MGANNLVCCLKQLRRIPNILDAFEPNPVESMKKLKKKNQINKRVLKSRRNIESVEGHLLQKTVELSTNHHVLYEASKNVYVYK